MCIEGRDSIFVMTALTFGRLLTFERLEDVGKTLERRWKHQLEQTLNNLTTTNLSSSSSRLHSNTSIDIHVSRRVTRVNANPSYSMVTCIRLKFHIFITDSYEKNETFSETASSACPIFFKTLF